MSADRNIDHGDNSCSAGGTFSELAGALDAAAALTDGCDAADGVGVAGAVADGAPADGDAVEGNVAGV
jgi:hypothetical protein